MSHTLSFMKILTTLGILRPAPAAHDPHRQKRIDDLPHDILYHIFLILVEDEFKKGRNVKFSQYPWALSEVCRAWRHVCMENSKLWAYLCLRKHADCPPKQILAYEDTDYKHSPKALLRTCLQIERSRGVLLHIDVQFSCRCKEQASYLRAALAHAHRWGSTNLDLTGPPERRAYGFVAVAGSFSHFKNLFQQNAAFSALRELTWSCNWPTLHLDDDMVQDGKLILPFHGSGDLTSLQSATFISLKHHDTDAAFPWKQLNTLVLHNYGGKILDLFTLLPKCDNLAHLELHIFQDHGLDPADLTGFANDPNSALHMFSAERGILLPNLISLVLSYQQYDVMAMGFNLLDFIKAPSLRRLDYWLDCNMVEFLQTITKCECSSSLKKLSMYYPARCFANGIDDGMCFEKGYGTLKELEHLSLQPSRWYLEMRNSHEPNEECDDFLEEMFFAKDGEGAPEHRLLPRLKDLELHNLEFDPVLLSHMAESRMNRGPDSIPLRSITATGAPCGSAYFKDALNTSLGKYTHGVTGLVLDVSPRSGK